MNALNDALLPMAEKFAQRVNFECEFNKDAAKLRDAAQKKDEDDAGKIAKAGAKSISATGTFNCCTRLPVRVYSQAMPFSSITRILPGVMGRGTRFPTGHWRNYREAFAEEFARLAPVAARLGYPAD